MPSRKKATVKDTNLNQDTESPEFLLRKYRAQQALHPYADHSALLMKLHIARIQARQKNEASRKEKEKEQSPEEKRIQAEKALEVAIADAELIQKKLDANEAEQSRLLSTTIGSNNASYIANVNAELEILKGLIDQNSRDLRTARKRLTAAEERVQEENRVRDSIKARYVVLSTKAVDVIAQEVQERRKRKIDQIMRQTEAPLVALEQQRNEAREQVIVNFGEAELQRLDEIIAAQR